MKALVGFNAGFQLIPKLDSKCGIMPTDGDSTNSQIIPVTGGAMAYGNMKKVRYKSDKGFERTEFTIVDRTNVSAMTPTVINAAMTTLTKKLCQNSGEPNSDVKFFSPTYCWEKPNGSV